MYDTIFGYLYEGEHFTLKSDRFFDGRGSKGIDGKFNVNTRFVNGLREIMKKNKKYYPLINLSEVMLGSAKKGNKRKVKRIELQTSLPKSCFGTNKYEINFKDYDLIVEKHLDYLHKADIVIREDQFKKLELAKLAIPKSIILPSYFGRAGQIIRKLTFFNHKPRSDFRYSQYDESVGGGMSLNFRNKIRQTCLYCKYGEILANGFTTEEEKIKEAVLSGKQTKNILRFELSFNHQQNLGAVLRRVMQNKNNKFTLDDIFTNGNISKQIIIEEFNKIFSEKNIFLMNLVEMKDNKLLHILENSSLTLNEKGKLYYMVNMAIKNGLNELWMSFKGNVSQSTKDRLGNKVIELKKELDNFKEPTEGIVEFLREELEKFELIRPENNQVEIQHPFNLQQKLL